MGTSRRPLALLAGILLVSIQASPALAQFLTHTWVASNGNDSANCARATPCATFGVAIGRTNAGGEITCLDSGNFGSGFTISKSITFDCENARGSWTTPSGTGLGTLNILTAATDIVTLRGLDFDGGGVAVSGATVGVIHFMGAGTLHLEKMKINNLRGTGIGLWFTPTGSARLDISDSTINDNGAGNILIQPTSGATVDALFNRVTVANSLFGIKADGSGQSTGQINVEVRDSAAGHHTSNGFIAVSDAGQAQIRYKITRSSSFNNGAFGAVASGAQAFMIVDGSSLTKNGTGLAQLNGSTVATYGNNGINFNASNTSGTITPITLK